MCSWLCRPSCGFLSSSAHSTSLTNQGARPHCSYLPVDGGGVSSRRVLVPPNPNELLISVPTRRPTAEWTAAGVSWGRHNQTSCSSVLLLVGRRRSGQQQACVGAAKPKRVAHCCLPAGRQLCIHIRHQPRQQRRRRMLQVDSRWRQTIAQRKHSEERLDGTGGAQQVPRRALGRGHCQARHVRPTEHPKDGALLHLVTERCRCCMSIDVGHVVHTDARALESARHGQRRARAVRRGLGDVVRVARHAVAPDFCNHGRPPRARMPQLFQHERARAVAHHKAVAARVKRAARERRGRVERGGQRLKPGESCQPNCATKCSLRCASHHHISIASLHHAERVANRVTTACACSAGRTVGTSKAVPYANHACRHVGQDARHEKWRQAAHLAACD
mmetsp:Transcript_467/g.1255  ORF Transcript_467/g.1255 Transcript_467/m.1255 type:complete len:390 (-) Transcript_467:1049-2218(-)